MTTPGAPSITGYDTAPPLLPGVAITGVTPDEHTALAAAMLIVLLAADGANVAAMVPVETGLEERCEQGSRGALIRWAAGHLDDPRHVTPFALEPDQSAMHAADTAGTLLHGAAFERAREALCDGRTVLTICDAVGALDPITPSLTMLDLIARWQLSVLIVEPVSRWAVGHVRLLASTLMSREIRVAGVVLSHIPRSQDPAFASIDAIRETLSALLDCPVVALPHVQSMHDRGELLTAARECGMQRIVSRIHA